MARTSSTQLLPLGTAMPKFALPHPTGALWGTDRKTGPILIAFICNHCPFVKHIREGFAELGKEYGTKGVTVVAINPNDFEEYPDDSPAKMMIEAKEAGYTFPYLVDNSQSVAKAYRAACTPDFFVFGKDLKLFYRGQMDDSRPGNGTPVTGKDLRNALDLALASKPAPLEQKPSIGCNIKWHKGNEPEYYKA